MTLWMLLMLPLLASLTAPASVAGSWSLSTNVQGNTGTSTCAFTQDGAKLTGSCTSPANTPLPVTGEIADSKVTFRYDIEWEGNPLTLVFSGTLDSETSMKGTIDVQPVNVGGDFTATKNK